MSSVNRQYPPERPSGRTQEDLARELESLAQRLASSREAIVQLLAENGGTAALKRSDVMALPAAPKPASTSDVPALGPVPVVRSLSWLDDNRRRMAAIILLAVGAVALLTALVNIW
ncbi:MAG TPA: hypothetical protein VL984_13015 [Acidimicrobiales bacterium]|nr:hypothetical protein [Acidimicrobiales bacterium]